MSSVRKIRIIYSDPYATDYSSDEDKITKDGFQLEGSKRFFKEISLPKTSGQLYPKTGKIKPKLTNKYKGVRLRKWGRFAAEIRDPIQKTRVWLGTFDSELEAAEVVAKKRNEFNEALQRRDATHSKDTKKPLSKNRKKYTKVSLSKKRKKYFNVPAHSPQSSLLDPYAIEGSLGASCSFIGQGESLSGDTAEQDNVV